MELQIGTMQLMKLLPFPHVIWATLTMHYTPVIQKSRAGEQGRKLDRSPSANMCQL